MDLDNPLHIPARRLEGSWKIHPDLYKRLSGKDLDRQQQAELTFVYDPAAVPKDSLRALAKRWDQKIRVYAVGRMKVGSKETPFFIADDVNPYLHLFEEREGDRFFKTERKSIVLAVAKDESADLLFLGGDRGPDQSLPFERINR
jgi:hypothetical protein